MANVNIKFNGKDYLLSCEDGQEGNLKELVDILNKELVKKTSSEWLKIFDEGAIV